MKRISVIVTVLMAFCLIAAVSSGISAADYPALYVGNTNVTATQGGTTYWLKDSAASPAPEFTETGASAGNYTFFVTYDDTDGYTLTADGLAVTTYGVYNDGSNTYQGGMICMSALDIVVGSGGLSVTETENGVNGIYTGGALSITGDGDVTVSSADTAIKASITCDVGGEVSLASSAASTVTSDATITAGDDISITTKGLAVTGNAVLTSESGGVTISAACSAPTFGRNLTVDSYDDVTLENTGGGMLVSGTSDITSQNGAITVDSDGSAPAFIGTAHMTAKGAIHVYNRAGSAFSASVELTSEEGGILVKGGNDSTSASVICATATMQAYGDITIENTGIGLAICSSADLTSQNGSVAVTSKSEAPTIGGTAAITAHYDITVTSEKYMAFGATANLSSALGNITVTGNDTGAPTISGPSTLHANGNIAVSNQGTGFVGGSDLNLTSTDGTVTATCNSGAPLVSGYINVSAKGDVSLVNQGTGNIATNGVNITSSAGAVTMTSATTAAPVIQSNAEITAYDDITITATAAGGGCISGYAKLTSQHGGIDVSGNSSYATIGGLAMGGISTLVAANDIFVANLGTDSVFCNPTTLYSAEGNINVSSVINYTANTTVKVNLGSLDKTATFTSMTSQAVPVGFTTDMIAYRVSGGPDKDHLSAISLAGAKDYSCVQFQLAFDVTAGSTNLGDFVDDGSGHYTITSADTLTYEQGGAPAAGVYLGAYFNGLSGVNGTDYYLSYGDSDSVTWDANKAITANGGEADPSLYVNLVNGERTLYVYFDPDADDTEFSGTVLSIQYQIPDDATYHDGTDDYTWDGASWVKSVSNPFGDVIEGSWYYDDVMYVYENGLMIGTAEGTFSPNDLLTRGALVLMLWRLEGEPDATAASSFTDVDENACYAQAVAWAAENGIVEGYTQEKFGPGDAITREQFATILYRYASYKEYNVGGSADLSGYTDAGQISAYALTAVKWANGNGLMMGTSAATLSPQGAATRAQAAALLHRFMVTFAEEG